VVLGLETFETIRQSFTTDWGAEDFFLEAPQPLATYDPWNPAPTKFVRTRLSKPALRIAAIQTRAADPWCPVEFDPGISAITLRPEDTWFQNISLPDFDPSARRAFWSLIDFDRPFVRDAKSKAAWIVAILQPSNDKGRKFFQRFFQELFLEISSDRFFEKLRMLANEIESSELFVAGIELRRLWEDSCEFRQIRVPRPGGVFYTHGPNLTWKAALQIAQAQCDCDPVDMIDREWLTDWRQLKRDSDGYWSFADYARRRAEEEKFADWDVPASILREEAKWLPSQSTPIDDVSGMRVTIHSGNKPVPAEIAKRFQHWREKHSDSRKETQRSTKPKEPSAVQAQTNPTLDEPIDGSAGKGMSVEQFCSSTPPSITDRSMATS
jgi:hypothetical protein